MGMRIAYDAKRAFANKRGLGNYSRDVIRLMQNFAPENEYLLFGIPSPLCDTSKARIVSPQGVWRAFPALWRSYGCIHDLGNPCKQAFPEFDQFTDSIPEGCCL